MCKHRIQVLRLSLNDLSVLILIKSIIPTEMVIMTTIIWLVFVEMDFPIRVDLNKPFTNLWTRYSLNKLPLTEEFNFGVQRKIRNISNLWSIWGPSRWSWSLKLEHSTEETHRCSIFAVPSSKSIGEQSTGVVFAENPAQSGHRCWPCYSRGDVAITGRGTG